MRRYFLNPLRGSLVVLLFTINLLIIPTLMIIAALLMKLIPNQHWRTKAMSTLPIFPAIWSWANSQVLKISTFGKWDIQGTGELNKKHWYMLVSNHRSWNDILVLSYVLGGKIPIIKFFMKRELIWTLPLAGMACYLAGYPFLIRHTREDIRKHPELKGKDIETTREACGLFKLYPTSIMNFLEGTRFTKEKHARQKSPYQYLLKPKAAGFAIVLEELHTHLNGILNITIFYDPEKPSLWDLFCGNIQKITVRYEILPVPPEAIGDYYHDRQFRKQFQAWLNDMWQTKDQLIQQLKQHEK